jgi:hypothetical protein
MRPIFCEIEKSAAPTNLGLRTFSPDAEKGVAAEFLP